MKTTSSPMDQIASALKSPHDGVIGLVDELLAVSRDHDLRLDWQDGKCRVRIVASGGSEEVDVPLRKSVMRAVLARVAALCNQQRRGSVSPYGGNGVLAVGGNGDALLHVTFANTADEQHLKLVRVLPAARQANDAK
jgi:hypothetical protein